MQVTCSAALHSNTLLKGCACVCKHAYSTHTHSTLYHTNYTLSILVDPFLNSDLPLQEGSVERRALEQLLQSIAGRVRVQHFCPAHDQHLHTEAAGYLVCPGLPLHP